MRGKRCPRRAAELSSPNGYPSCRFLSSLLHTFTTGQNPSEETRREETAGGPGTGGKGPGTAVHPTAQQQHQELLFL